MDPVLINFLLQNIGLPVVSAIIRWHRSQNNNQMPTSEEVIQHFLDDVKKWTDQGRNWLAANPESAKA